MGSLLPQIKHIVWNDIDKFISWIQTDRVNQYTSNVEYIVGVSRGGVIPAIVVSEYLSCSMGLVSCKSYVDVTRKFIGKKTNVFDFSNINVCFDDVYNKHILIVDEIVDSGETVIRVAEFLLAFKPASIKIMSVVTKHIFSVTLSLGVKIDILSMLTIDKTVWCSFAWERCSGNFGKKRTKEQILQRQQTRKRNAVERGYWVHPDVVKKIGLIKRGRPTKNKGRKCSLRVRKKFSRAQRKRWSLVGLEDKSLFIHKKVPSGYVQGIFYSYKNKCDLRFQSSYELYAFIKLEHDDNVVAFERCHFAMWYTIDGKKRRYIPDVFITFCDNSKGVLEIKPLGRLTQRDTIQKLYSLQQYCTERNYRYMVWTEREIFTDTEKK